MEGLTEYHQIAIGIIAVVAAVLGFGLGIKVRFVSNSCTKEAPTLLSLMGGIAGAVSVAVLGFTGRPIACAGLFVSSLVMGVGLAFMAEPRKVERAESQ